MPSGFVTYNKYGPNTYFADSEMNLPRRKRQQFLTPQEADEYDAQKAIETARGSGLGNLTNQPEVIGEGGLGNLTQKDTSAGLGNIAVKDLVRPGGKYGMTDVGKAAYGDLLIEENKKKDQEAFDVIKSRPELMEDPKQIAITLMDAGRYDEAAQFLSGLSKEKVKQDAGGYGRSSKGAAYEFTASHPELIEKLNSQLDLLEGAGIDKTLIQGWRQQGQADVDSAQKSVNSYLARIKGEVQKIEETLPGKVKTAAQTTAASTASKIGTEAGMADISANTAGIIAGGKEKGKRDAGLTLSASEAGKIGDFNASLAQLNVLSESFSNPDAPQGPISQIRKANPYDWQAQAKQQLVAATKQLVGKALEGGVLKAEDEKKYEKILPKIGDTYDSAIQKTKNLETMIGNAYNSRLEALRNSGYDVSKFEKKESKNILTPRGRPPQDEIDNTKIQAFIERARQQGYSEEEIKNYISRMK